MMLRNRFIILTFCVLAIIFIQGCTVNHYIAKDYPEYLKQRNNSSRTSGKGKQTFYQLTDGTKNVAFDIQVMLVGQGHIWVVQMGAMLSSYLESNNPLSESIEFRPVAKNEKADELFIFDLQKYVFNRGTAHIDLSLKLIRDGKELFSKDYSEGGENLFEKMILGGPFVTKSVIQQSTTSALDAIFRKMFVDLKSMTTQPPNQ